MWGANNANYQHTIDQRHRNVPINLRQTGDPNIRMLIWNRLRKSPYWHLSMEQGAWRATVYNGMYHPFGYVRPEDGGQPVEYRALINDVTMWDVAVERAIRVKGPEAEAFCNYVCTRDVTRVPAMMGRYVILCNEAGHVLNDPVMLRVANDEFWFTLSDSDLMYWFWGVNLGMRFDVEIAEIDVCPLQIQGPKSEPLMADLVGEGVRELPYYGLMSTQIAGVDCLVSQTGFSGEKGYEIYPYNATTNAETLWYTVLEAGRPYNLMVTAPPHQRRVQAGILSYGQDLDKETNPFQCMLGHMVPKTKTAEYVGKAVLERTRDRVQAGDPPFKHMLVGLKIGGRPVEDHPPDFWLIGDPHTEEPVGWVTSIFYSPELDVNVAMGYVPVDRTALGTAFAVWLPRRYQTVPGRPEGAEVADVPFRPSVHPSARERARAEGRESAY
jgi:aminomethyltransferase